MLRLTEICTDSVVTMVGVVELLDNTAGIELYVWLRLEQWTYFVWPNICACWVDTWMSICMSKFKKQRNTYDAMMLHQISHVTACSIERALTLKFSICVDYCNSSIKLVCRIAGNFRMVQIFTYFEHMRIVQELEPTKLFTRHYPTLSHTATFCLLRRSSCPCKYGSLVSSSW